MRPPPPRNCSRDATISGHFLRSSICQQQGQSERERRFTVARTESFIRTMGVWLGLLGYSKVKSVLALISPNRKSTQGFAINKCTSTIWLHMSISLCTVNLLNRIKL